MTENTEGSTVSTTQTEHPAPGVVEHIAHVGPIVAGERIGEEHVETPAVTVATVTPTTVPATPVAVSDTAVHDIIMAWVQGHIRNSPVSQSTLAYNHLLGALPALRDAIVKGVT
jgi:hypothetical protein